MRAYRPSDYPISDERDMAVIESRIRLYALRVAAGLPLFGDYPGESSRNPAAPDSPGASPVQGRHTAA